MGSPNDIQKLLGNMKRAQDLTDEAANSARTSESVMDNFAKTLDTFNNHVGKIKEYDAQLAAMMAVTDNGGPPLDTTFPPPTDVVHTIPVVEPVAEAPTTSFDVQGVAVSEINKA